MHERRRELGPWVGELGDMHEDRTSDSFNNTFHKKAFMVIAIFELFLFTSKAIHE